MSITPKTQTVAGVTFTWQTLKGVTPGARFGLTAKGVLASCKTIGSLRRGSQGGEIVFTDGTTKSIGGTATKYWVASAAPVEAAPAAPKANRIPADAAEYACAKCGETLPVSKFPTVSGPTDRATTCRSCRKAA